MKTIIYTPENEIENETGIISSILDAGADFLYIRKPNLDDYSLVDYMEKFSPKYYAKIITTSLIITKEFDLAGYHFTRDVIQKNDSYNSRLSDWLRSKNKISSVSAHNLEELNEYAGIFDHVIVSPVFKSISKEELQPGYKHEELKEALARVRKECFKTLFFAVGGIERSKVVLVKHMNFDGAGLLGAIWNDPGNALSAFILTKNSLEA